MQQESAIKTRIYVSANGDDGNTGDSIDRSFSTLERARDAIREMKRTTGLPEGGVLVEIGGGTYFREEVFALNESDSGEPGAPIVYRARSGEEVKISGGKKVDNFKRVTDPAILERIEPDARESIYQADLKAMGIPEYGAVDDGGLELFFNNKPMTVSRWPNDGFTKISGLHGGDPVDVRGTKGDKTGKFMYDGDRPKRWTEEKDMWVHGYWFWDWSDQRHAVESIDTEKRMISVKPPYHRYGYRIGQWFYALNALSEIDVPGEWYLDRGMGILYFYPPSSIESGEAIVSILPTSVDMQDVSYTTIEGITFEATRDTAITMTGGTGNRIDGCTLCNLGNGVTITGGSANGVANCDIFEIANRAIVLTGGDRATLSPAGHYADNNDIHNYGRWNRMYRAGISLNGVGQRASNNYVHDAPHMAIVFSGNDHRIEFNEICNVCYESNDAGAIYAGRDWTMRGNIIRHNYLHDISGFENKGCVGVYLDDMFCGTLMYGNIFYKVTMATFVGGGRDCTIENNIFVDCVPSVHIDNRAMNWASYHVDTTMTDRLNEMPYKNELWATRYPILIDILEDEPAAPKGNIVVRNISIGGNWNGIREGAEPYVTVADNVFDKDPHFVGTPPENFALKEDSPAYSLGFKPIPFEKIGLER